MKGFEKKFSTKEQELVDGLKEKTLWAMEDGTAMPLPSFLKENAEARRIFVDALKKSEELHQNLDLLSEAEREAFIKVFDKELSNLPSSKASNAVFFSGVGLAVGTGAMGVSAGVELEKITTGLAVGVLVMASSVIADIKGIVERNEIKRLIRRAVLG